MFKLVATTSGNCPPEQEQFQQAMGALLQLASKMAAGGNAPDLERSIASVQQAITALPPNLRSLGQQDLQTILQQIHSNQALMSAAPGMADDLKRIEELAERTARLNRTVSEVTGLNPDSLLGQMQQSANLSVLLHDRARTTQSLQQQQDQLRARLTEEGQQQNSRQIIALAQRIPRLVEQQIALSTPQAQPITPDAQKVERLTQRFREVAAQPWIYEQLQEPIQVLQRLFGELGESLQGQTLPQDVAEALNTSLEAFERLNAQGPRGLARLTDHLDPIATGNRPIQNQYDLARSMAEQVQRRYEDVLPQYQPGMTPAISAPLTPIERLAQQRDTLEGQLAGQQSESRFYDLGAALNQGMSLTDAIDALNGSADPATIEGIYQHLAEKLRSTELQKAYPDELGRKAQLIQYTRALTNEMDAERDHLRQQIASISRQMETLQQRMATPSAQLPAPVQSVSGEWSYPAMVERLQGRRLNYPESGNLGLSVPDQERLMARGLNAFLIQQGIRVPRPPFPQDRHMKPQERAAARNRAWLKNLAREARHVLAAMAATALAREAVARNAPLLEVVKQLQLPGYESIETLHRATLLNPHRNQRESLEQVVMDAFSVEKGRVNLDRIHGMGVNRSQRVLADRIVARVQAYTQSIGGLPYDEAAVRQVAQYLANIGTYLPLPHDPNALQGMAALVDLAGDDQDADQRIQEGFGQIVTSSAGPYRHLEEEADFWRAAVDNPVLLWSVGPASRGLRMITPSGGRPYLTDDYQAPAGTRLNFGQTLAGGALTRDTTHIESEITRDAEDPARMRLLPGAPVEMMPALAPREAGIMGARDYSRANNPPPGPNAIATDAAIQKLQEQEAGYADWTESHAFMHEQALLASFEPYLLSMPLFQGGQTPITADQFRIQRAAQRDWAWGRLAMQADISPKGERVRATIPQWFDELAKYFTRQLGQGSRHYSQEGEDLALAYLRQFASQQQDGSLLTHERQALARLEEVPHTIMTLPGNLFSDEELRGLRDLVAELGPPTDAAGNPLLDEPLVDIAGLVQARRHRDAGNDFASAQDAHLLAARVMTLPELIVGTTLQNRESTARLIAYAGERVGRGRATPGSLIFPFEADKRGPITGGEEDNPSRALLDPNLWYKAHRTAALAPLAGATHFTHSMAVYAVALQDMQEKLIHRQHLQAQGGDYQRAMEARRMREISGRKAAVQDAIRARRRQLGRVGKNDPIIQGLEQEMAQLNLPMVVQDVPRLSPEDLRLMTLGLAGIVEGMGIGGHGEDVKDVDAAISRAVELVRNTGYIEQDDLHQQLRGLLRETGASLLATGRITAGQVLQGAKLLGLSTQGMRGHISAAQWAQMTPDQQRDALLAWTRNEGANPLFLPGMDEVPVAQLPSFARMIGSIIAGGVEDIHPNPAAKKPAEDVQLGKGIAALHSMGLEGQLAPQEAMLYGLFPQADEDTQALIRARTEYNRGGVAEHGGRLTRIQNLSFGDLAANMGQDILPDAQLLAEIRAAEKRFGLSPIQAAAYVAAKHVIPGFDMSEDDVPPVPPEGGTGALSAGPIGIEQEESPLPIPTELTALPEGGRYALEGDFGDVLVPAASGSAPPAGNLPAPRSPEEPLRSAEEIRRLFYDLTDFTMIGRWGGDESQATIDPRGIRRHQEAFHQMQRQLAAAHPSDEEVRRTLLALPGLAGRDDLVDAVMGSTHLTRHGVTERIHDLAARLPYWFTPGAEGIGPKEIHEGEAAWVPIIKFREIQEAFQSGDAGAIIAALGSYQRWDGQHHDSEGALKALLAAVGRQDDSHAGEGKPAPALDELRMQLGMLYGRYPTLDRRFGEVRRRQPLGPGYRHTPDHHFGRSLLPGVAGSGRRAYPFRSERRRIKINQRWLEQLEDVYRGTDEQRPEYRGFLGGRTARGTIIDSELVPAEVLALPDVAGNPFDLAFNPLAAQRWNPRAAPGQEPAFSIFDSFSAPSIATHVAAQAPPLGPAFLETIRSHLPSLRKKRFGLPLLRGLAAGHPLPPPGTDRRDSYARDLPNAGFLSALPPGEPPGSPREEPPEELPPVSLPPPGPPPSPPPPVSSPPPDELEPQGVPLEQIMAGMTPEQAAFFAEVVAPGAERIHTLSANPGSGKTYTVARTVVGLLHGGAVKRSALLVTPTKSGQTALEREIKGVLREGHRRDAQFVPGSLIKVRTYGQIGYNAMIRGNKEEFWHALGWEQQPRQRTTEQVALRRLLRSFLDKGYISAAEHMRLSTPEALDDLSDRVQRFFASPELFRDALKKGKEQLAGGVFQTDEDEALLYGMIEQMKGDRTWTHNLNQIALAMIAEDPALAQRMHEVLGGGAGVVGFDETQRSTVAQRLIARIIAGARTGRILLSGDPNQQLAPGMQGHRQPIHELGEVAQEMFSSPGQAHHLQTNMRSPAPLVAFANAFPMVPDLAGRTHPSFYAPDAEHFRPLASLGPQDFPRVLRLPHEQAEYQQMALDMLAALGIPLEEARGIQTDEDLSASMQKRSPRDALALFARHSDIDAFERSVRGLGLNPKVLFGPLHPDLSHYSDEARSEAARIARLRIPFSTIFGAGGEQAPHLFIAGGQGFGRGTPEEQIFSLQRMFNIGSTRGVQSARFYIPANKLDYTHYQALGDQFTIDHRGHMSGRTGQDLGEAPFTAAFPPGVSSQEHLAQVKGIAAIFVAQHLLGMATGIAPEQLPDEFIETVQSLRPDQRQEVMDYALEEGARQARQIARRPDAHLASSRQGMRDFYSTQYPLLPIQFEQAPYIQPGIMTQALTDRTTRPGRLPAHAEYAQGAQYALQTANPWHRQEEMEFYDWKQLRGPVYPVRPFQSDEVPPQGIRPEQSLAYIAVESREGVKGLGSGIFLGSSGHILTNAHVLGQGIAGEPHPMSDEYGRMRRLRVMMPDGRLMAAEVIHSDADRDLAIIKTDPHAFPGATWASSADVRAGQPIRTLGNAKGFWGVQNQGVVLAPNLYPQGQGQIMTSADIYPGDSGGMLLDEQGRVIGMNAAYRADHSMHIPSDVISQYVADVFTQQQLPIPQPFAGDRLAPRAIPPHRVHPQITALFNEAKSGILEKEDMPGFEARVQLARKRGLINDRDVVELRSLATRSLYNFGLSRTPTLKRPGSRQAGMRLAGDWEDPGISPSDVSPDEFPHGRHRPPTPEQRAAMEQSAREAQQIASLWAMSRGHEAANPETFATQLREAQESGLVGADLAERLQRAFETLPQIESAEPPAPPPVSSPPPDELEPQGVPWSGFSPHGTPLSPEVVSLLAPPPEEPPPGPPPPVPAAPPAPPAPIANPLPGEQLEHLTPIEPSVIHPTVKHLYDVAMGRVPATRREFHDLIQRAADEGLVSQEHAKFLVDTYLAQGMSPRGQRDLPPTPDTIALGPAGLDPQAIPLGPANSTRAEEVEARMAGARGALGEFLDTATAAHPQTDRQALLHRLGNFRALPPEVATALDTLSDADLGHVLHAVQNNTPIDPTQMKANVEALAKIMTFFGSVPENVVTGAKIQGQLGSGRPIDQGGYGTPSGAGGGGRAGSPFGLVPMGGGSSGGGGAPPGETVINRGGYYSGGGGRGSGWQGMLGSIQRIGTSLARATFEMNFALMQMQQDQQLQLQTGGDFRLAGAIAAVQGGLQPGQPSAISQGIQGIFNLWGASSGVGLNPGQNSGGPYVSQVMRNPLVAGVLQAVPGMSALDAVQALGQYNNLLGGNISSSANVGQTVNNLQQLYVVSRVTGQPIDQVMAQAGMAGSAGYRPGAGAAGPQFANASMAAVQNAWAIGGAYGVQPALQALGSMSYYGNAEQQAGFLAAGNVAFGNTPGNLQQLANVYTTLGGALNSPSAQQLVAMAYAYNPQMQQANGQGNPFAAVAAMQRQVPGMVLPASYLQAQAGYIQQGVQMQQLQAQIQLKIPQLTINADTANINMASASYQIQGQQIGQQQQQLNFQMWYDTQMYGPPGVDLSKDAYYNFMRSAQAASRNPMDAGQISLGNVGAFGLKNLEFYANIEYQKQQLMYSRNPLMSDLGFKSNINYLNQQEAFYNKEVQLQGEQRVKTYAWQQNTIDWQRKLWEVAGQQLAAQNAQLKADIAMQEKQTAWNQQLLGALGLSQQAVVTGLNNPNSLRTVTPWQLVQHFSQSYAANPKAIEQDILNLMGGNTANAQTMLSVTRYLSANPQFLGMTPAQILAHDKTANASLLNHLAKLPFNAQQAVQASQVDASLLAQNNTSSFTDFANHLKTINIDMGKLSGTFQNLNDNLGVFGDVLGKATPFLLAISAIANVAGIGVGILNIVKMGGLLSRLGSILTGGAADAGAAAGAGDVIDAAATVLGGAAAGAGGIAEVGGGLLAALAAPEVAIPLAAAAVIGGTAWGLTHQKQLHDWGVQLHKKPVLGGIGDFFDASGRLNQNIIHGIGHVAGGIGHWFDTHSPIQQIGTWAGGVGHFFDTHSPIQQLQTWAKAAGTFFHDFGTNAHKAWDTVQKDSGQLWHAVTNQIGSWKDDAWNKFKDFGKLELQMWNGFKSNAGTILGGVGKTLAGLFDAPPIQGAVKWVQQIGATLGTAFTNALHGIGQLVWNLLGPAISGPIKQVLTGIRNMLSHFTWVPGLGGLLSGIDSGINAFVGATAAPYFGGAAILGGNLTGSSQTYHMPAGVTASTASNHNINLNVTLNGGQQANVTLTNEQADHLSATAINAITQALQSALKGSAR
jgi:S1-C subfamily serine protease